MLVILNYMKDLLRNIYHWKIDSGTYTFNANELQLF